MTQSEDADSQGLLQEALRLMRGDGVRQDWSRGLVLMEKAADQGLAEAQARLGIALFTGEGGHSDPELATAWVRLAAAQGSAPGLMNLGMLATVGQSVPRSPELAYHCLYRAAYQQTWPDAPKWYRQLPEVFTAEELAAAKAAFRHPDITFILGPPIEGTSLAPRDLFDQYQREHGLVQRKREEVDPNQVDGETASSGGWEAYEKTVLQTLFGGDKSFPPLFESEEPLPPTPYAYVSSYLRGDRLGGVSWSLGDLVSADGLPIASPPSMPMMNVYGNVLAGLCGRQWSWGSVWVPDYCADSDTVDPDSPLVSLSLAHAQFMMGRLWDQRSNADPSVMGHAVRWYERSAESGYRLAQEALAGLSKSSDDLGLRAIVDLFRQLQVDTEWSTRTERGFSWIGLSLEQTITAAPVQRDGELLLVKLTARTVVVEHVSTDIPVLVLLDVLNTANRHALGSAYSFEASTGCISASFVTWVHQETYDWRCQQFGAYAANQLAVAESEADYLASTLGGTVAGREHPLSGRRVQRDDMLNWLDASSSWGPSRFADRDEFESLVHFARSTTMLATLGADESGVTFDVPYGDARTWSAEFPATCLLQVHADEPHRRAGVGLTVRLRFPMPLTPDEASAYANRFNLEEARGASEATHYGAWCWDTWGREGGVDLAYQVFIPNALYRVGVMQDAVLSMVKRTRWMDWGLHGQVAKTNAWTTMFGRFKGLLGLDK